MKADLVFLKTNVPINVVLVTLTLLTSVLLVPTLTEMFKTIVSVLMDSSIITQLPAKNVYTLVKTVLMKTLVYLVLIMIIELAIANV